MKKLVIIDYINECVDIIENVSFTTNEQVEEYLEENYSLDNISFIVTDTINNL